MQGQAAGKLFLVENIFAEVTTVTKQQEGRRPADCPCLLLLFLLKQQAELAEGQAMKCRAPLPNHRSAPSRLHPRGSRRGTRRLVLC